MAKILLLEDDPQFVSAFKETLDTHSKKSIDKLSVFDKLLYDDPGFENFDLILMDVALKVSQDEIAWLKNNVASLYDNAGVRVNTAPSTEQ